MPRPSDSELQYGLTALLGGWEERAVEEYARKFSAAQREKLAKEGKALSDGSYPIETSADIGPALALAKSGHGDASAAMAHIRKRAKQLGVKLTEKAAAMKQCPTCDGSGKVPASY